MKIETAPIALAPVEGPCVSVQGGTYRILLSGSQTGGAYTCIEMLIPPEAGPGPHMHPEIYESFYVAEGEVTFRSEAGAFIATRGAHVTIPLGAGAHSFRNHTEAPARLLCTAVPAGLDAFFMEVGQPVAPGAFLPRPLMTAAWMEQVRAAAQRHGQTILPPDYLDHVR